MFIIDLHNAHQILTQMRFLPSIIICIFFISCRNKEVISKEYLLGIWHLDSVTIYKKGQTQFRPSDSYVNFNEFGNRVFFNEDSMWNVDFYSVENGRFRTGGTSIPERDEKTEIISKNKFIIIDERQGDIESFFIRKQYYSRTQYQKVEEIYKHELAESKKNQSRNNSIEGLSNPDLISMQNNTKELVTDDRSSMGGVKLKLTIPKNWEPKPLIGNSAYVFGEPNYSIVTSIRVLDSYNYESDLSLSSIDSVKQMVSQSFNADNMITNSFVINNKKVFQVDFVSKQETGIGQLFTGNNLYVFVSNRKMVLLSYSIVRTKEKFKETEIREFNTLFNGLMSKTEILSN